MGTTFDKEKKGNNTGFEPATIECGVHVQTFHMSGPNRLEYLEMPY